MASRPDEPYSYKADPNLKQNFDKWRPYFLRWCLDGLKAYHAQGFTRIPASCTAFKEEIIAEKNVVAEFLKDAVEPGDPKDFVHVKELYSRTCRGTQISNRLLLQITLYIQTRCQNE